MIAAATTTAIFALAAYACVPQLEIVVVGPQNAVSTRESVCVPPLETAAKPAMNNASLKFAKLFLPTLQPVFSFSVAAGYVWMKAHVVTNKKK